MGKTYWSGRIAVLLSLLCLVAAGCGAPVIEDEFQVLTGEYFGQEPPGAEAELFAPGLITTGMITRDIAISPGGDEIYFCVATPGYAYSAILFTRLVDGRWTRPEVAPFSADPEWRDMEPAISPDGRQFFFYSDRPAAEGAEGNSDIWVMDRQGDGWGVPRNLGAPVCSDAPEFFPSITNDGTLYFSRADPQTRVHFIYRSRFVNDSYQEPELLPEEVNCGVNRFNAFVAADESYIIVPAAGVEDSRGGVDYYIAFRDEDDKWTGPINMGDQVNSASMSEWSPFVSRDGRFLFFMSARQPDVDEHALLDYARMLARHNSPQNGNADIYWLDAGIIEELRAGVGDEAAKEVGHE